ncbi:h domain protein [Nocardia panacis]|uniref:H domain protein n=1 Tax=Nocardia panacis TaxID=2340916 RepID=A0A3A4KU77_9NOCA|nr:h domain protein [Nocardia panacis]RJO78701.1 h domain protein [Nocardia panacis]
MTIPRMPWRPILFGAGGLVVAAALVLCGVAGLRYWQLRQDEQSRAEATAVATRDVEGMFTYNYQNVDSVVESAIRNLRGSVRDEYEAVSKQLIIPGAKEKQLTVVCNVQAAGVVSANPNHAVVLLFLNQSSTPKDNPKATVAASRLRVTLDRDGGQWVLSEAKPV